MLFLNTGSLGKNIKSVSTLKSLSRNLTLYAGTAWLFSKNIFDQQLDYLFVDEAGQVSLANTVAIATSTKNL